MKNINELQQQYPEYFKTCVKCGEVKLKSLFVRDKTNKRAGIRNYCKACNKRTAKELRTERNHEFVCEYLLRNPCVKCGYTDIRALEFNHIRGIKANNVSELVYRGVSLSKITEEINKCEVLCANCHRIYTMSEGKHFRHIYVEKNKS